jgi:DNA primase
MSTRIPHNFSNELVSKIPASEVVSKKVALKFNGKEFSGLCPFHNEKTPSFTVNDQKEFYHCFGCGAHGSIINFIMETEGVGFVEAITQLAEEHNIPIPEVKVSENEEKIYDEIKELQNINEEACKFFQKNLNESIGKQALIYLKNRGLNLGNIQKFRLGFAIGSYDALIKHLKSLNFTESAILKSGLASKKEKGMYDKFRNRVMFPITDKKSRIIAFSGRVLDDSLPKYMNSPETKIYHKGEIVFNYAMARKVVYDKGFVVLVEGNMDAISLYCNGIENVVAPMGTAITLNQIKELWGITDNIVVCLDGDAAGIKATKRIVDMVLPIITPQKLIKFVFLPSGYDPDTFIKENGTKSLQKLLEHPTPLSEIIWNDEFEKLKLHQKKTISAEEKAKLESILMKKTELINNSASNKHFKEFYKNKLWELTRFNKNDIIVQKTKTDLMGNTLRSRLSTDEKLKNYERNIIATLIKYPKLINENFNNIFNIKNIEFLNEQNLTLKDLIIDFIEENEEINQKKFLSTIEKNGFNDYIVYSEHFLRNFSDEQEVKKILELALNNYYLLLLKKDKLALLSSNELTGINRLEEEIKKIEKNISLLISSD